MSQKYIKSQNKNSHNAKSLLKDVAFEEAHGQTVAANSPSQGGSTSGPDTSNPDDGE